MGNVKERKTETLPMRLSYLRMKFAAASKGGNHERLGIAAQRVFQQVR